MAKLTQEELNSLSPRARKALGEADEILQEIVTINPNAETKEEPKKEKKENKNEKLVVRDVSIGAVVRLGHSHGPN